MHGPTVGESSPLIWRDFIVSLAILVAAFLVFHHSPVTYIGDSKYSVLLSENLLRKGTFTLDDYGIPRRTPLEYRGVVLDGDIYQIEIVGGHLYYYFPPGSSILSAPFVAAANAYGLSAVQPDGSYLFKNEEDIQRLVAAWLMAILAVVFYFACRLLLPLGWSVCIALGAAFGTQIWSTASRAWWTHTWGVLLLGGAIYLLLGRETGRRKLHPVLLASILSWTYFVRPTNSIFIVGITLYVFVSERRAFLAYAATGAAWFAAFVVYSWSHFGKVLPSYYQASRLEVTQFWEATAGNLVSPSRGLLLYVPAVWIVGWLLARHWSWLPFRRLVWLALGVSAGHFLAISCFTPWYGGICYGPRYTTELVPWFVLLAALGVRAMLQKRDAYLVPRNARTWNVSLAAGGGVLLLSACINGWGANALPTVRWNQLPVLLDLEPARVWNWRYPQMLAGIMRVPPPAVFPPLLAGGIRFGGDAGRDFLLEGWSNSNRNYCWSEGRTATLIFAADDLSANQLRLEFGAHVYRSRLRKQKVIISLNEYRVGSLLADLPDIRAYAFPLPPGALQRKNILTFRLPNATAPQSIGENADPRLLGISLQSLKLDKESLKLDKESLKLDKAVPLGASPSPAGAAPAP